MKLTEYPLVSDLKAGDVLLLGGDRGTKQIPAEDFPFAVINMAGAINHRRFFRGKNLGTAITSQQLAAIEDGSFNDLWLGDYWVINGINWRIWDFDYWIKAGDSSFTRHHLVIMPDSILYSAKMNDTNITTGGYVGSAMYTSNLANAKTIVSSAFGSAVLTHREYLTNAVANGYPSAGAWYDSNVELPNEIMMYGSYVFTPGSDGSAVPNRYTISKKQLALAAIAPEYVNIRSTYWLRDVVNASNFADVSSYGYALCSFASYSFGVRPVFPVGVAA